MTSLGSAVASTLLLSCALVACGPGGTTYDLVLEGGRVLDPETGFDRIANVGIRGGTIAEVSDRELRGRRVVDASGLVVAPGFIDLHEHGQTDEAYRVMVRDGVTTALELEVGTGDVDAWYAERAGGQRVNFGASVGHIPVRMDVLGDPGTGLLPAGVGGSGVATPGQLDAIEARLRRGLDRGALAVGFGSAYTPGATMAEIERMFRVAADYGASVHIHMRGGVAGLDSTIAAARRAGAPLHIVHVNSSAGEDLGAFLAAIRAAREAGQDVTTETYPYRAGMTEITSALFDDWRSWPDERFAELRYVPTGQRLTRETFPAAREAGGTVIIFSRTEEQTRAAVASPLAMIASDGFIVDGRGHPRTSGTYSKVLGRYVRDRGLLALPEAVARMTIMPARRLEARAPAFARKGRLREGMDADITLFDPGKVLDRSTYEDPAEPAAGIPYVIVGGELVVDGGELTGARPGVGVRAPVR
ncbi:MAG TPA: amidohydrolase family protein [Gemmatimonadota bacterium]|nr:amidohydrolase family protein [Gemmatimonadota bacterium]